MPILYVNPAPRRGKARKVRTRKIASGTISPKTSRRRKRVRKHGRKIAIVVRAPRATKRKGTKMARKLYGAAAKAHAKRLSKLHRRKKRKSNPRRRRRARRRNPATVAAAPASNPRRRRRRKARKANPMRRRRMHRRRRNPLPSDPLSVLSAKPRRRKRRTGLKSLAKARRTIKRYRRRKRGVAYAYVKRHRMMTNPRRRRSRRKARRSNPRRRRRSRSRRHNPRRRSHRRYRRNPGLRGITGAPGMLMAAVRGAVPVAASLYLTRFLINKFGPSIPMVDKLGSFSKPAVAGLTVLVADQLTKRTGLRKWRGGIMLGTSLNFVDSLVSAFAPASVKSMFGLGDSGLYDQAMGEFVTTSDYLEVGAEPIDDDIALSDYVEMSGVEEELGAIQEELGVEEELGTLSPRRLGGVSQSSMLKALKPASAIGVVPTRSFTKQVPAAGPGYDNPSALYTGVFSGGF